MCSYLKDQGEDPNEVCYETKYALRLCLGKENGTNTAILYRACVIIYTVMRLYEEAVGMALKVLLSVLYIRMLYKLLTTYIRVFSACMGCFIL